MSTNSQFDEHHNAGEQGHYRDLLANEPGNPDHVEAPWEEVGVDKPIVDHKVVLVDDSEMDKKEYEEIMEVF